MVDTLTPRKVGQAFRGRGLEKMVERSCEIYALRGWGCVQKIATPTVQRGGDFTRLRSTVDFIGVYTGIPLAFDAKETRQARFDLSAVKSHQVKFLKQFEAGGGRGFLLVEFVHQRLIYGVTWDWLEETAEQLSRASVPLGAFETAAGLGIGCTEVPQGKLGVPCHFGYVVQEEAEHGV